MSGVAAFLRQLDDAWSHRWESLDGALSDLLGESLRLVLVTVRVLDQL